MFTEDRKIQLLEEVLKTTNETVLVEVEHLLKQSKKKPKSNKRKQSIYDFVGIISKKDAEVMEKAIKETCETVNADDWK